MSIRGREGGMLDIELTCVDSEIIWNALHASGVDIYHLLKKDDLTYICRTRGIEYKKIKQICEKKGASVKIKRKTGLFWFCRSAIRRPVFLAGWCAIVLIACSLPSRVMFVQVEGNNVVATRRILEAAEKAGIYFGASRREIRSEKVKNDLLEQIPQLRWAGINTTGCTAVISVRERMESVDEGQTNTPVNIVASLDGYILSGTVEEGTAKFQPGQTVKAGQLLISGYTDCGIAVSATRARGEIYAETRRILRGITPSKYEKKRAEKQIGRKISLLYQKKRINLWKDSGISDGTCGRMYKEYYINLPGDFALPIAICVETYYAYDTERYSLTQEEAEAVLSMRAEDYMAQQMIAGEFVKKVEEVHAQEGTFLLHASYVCREMIGKVQEIQIGDTNGKID